MVQVKIYECPECSEQFSTAQIKKSGHKCPGCSTPLKHDLDKSAGKLVHVWVVDKDQDDIDTNHKMDSTEKIFRRISNRGDTPEMYKRIAPPVKEFDSAYRVVYLDKYGPTDLHCPICRTYLHTTNYISGSKQQTFCRSTVQTDDGWMKCKTRTEFWFFRQGEIFDATTD